MEGKESKHGGTTHLERSRRGIVDGPVDHDRVAELLLQQALIRGGLRGVRGQQACQGVAAQYVTCRGVTC